MSSRKEVRTDKPKETALLEQERPQRESTLNQCNRRRHECQENRNRSNELNQLCISKGVPMRDMVKIVKTIYPRFDKSLLSKCRHGDEYGVDLRHDAMAALRKEYGISPVATPQDEQKEAAAISTPKPDNRRLKCRISCRLEDAEYDALLRYIKADGFDTMQAWLSMTVRRYIKRRAAKEAEE